MTLEKLLRCKTIIEEVKNSSYTSTMANICEAVNKMLGSLYSINETGHKVVGERTIKRDIEDIRRTFEINIEYDSDEKGYFIKLNKSEPQIEALLEAAQLVHVLQNMENIKPYIAFEPRKAKTGSKFFFEILEAIKDKKKIEFKYTQYEKKEQTKRLVSPLGLKEFKGFWYLIAQDESGIKTFGLDRINDLTLTSQKLKKIENFSLDKYYEHCYGIVRFPDEGPQEILIKASPIKASYYKANPLHKSQKVVEETAEYTVFSLTVCLTYDLQQELRSHGEQDVMIIQPKDGMITKRYY